MLSLSLCRMMSFFLGVSEVCYMIGPVGDCFFCCPNSRNDVQYKLFTRSNPTNYQQLFPGNVDVLLGSTFNPANPTVIYLFGFSEAVTGPSTTTLRNAFLSRDNYNFIAVDWARLIAFPWYIHAVNNTRDMGLRLADFVQYLIEAGVPASTLHVIGFSLGAEAAGFAGKALKARGVLLGRITGLDPALPGYSVNDPSAHLSKGDAAFVDVIHTNPGVLGFPQPIGDVDFYPNFGEWIQPGCWLHQLIRNKQERFYYGCSHNRAWRLFAESIVTPRGFPATLCKDWKSATTQCRFQIHGYMGFAANPTFDVCCYPLDGLYFTGALEASTKDATSLRELLPPDGVDIQAHGHCESKL